MRLIRTANLVNSNYFGMHLLFVCLDAPEVATGELSAPPDAQNRILLPGNLCNELQEIEGSAIMLSTTPGSAATPRVWHSQIELLRRIGTNITAWVVPTPEGN